MAHLKSWFVKRFGEELLAVGECHHLLQGGFGMVFHVGGDDMQSDEGSEAARGGVAEVTGERGLVHEAADHLVVFGVDHVLFDEILPHLLFVLGGPLVLVVGVAEDLLRGGIGEHGGGEEEFFALEDHVVQGGDGCFFGQMFVGQPFVEAVKGDEVAFAAGGDVLGHAREGVVFAILAEVHVEADEEVVVVAEHGGQAEVHAGHEGVDRGHGGVGEVGEVVLHGLVQCGGDVLHVTVLLLGLLIEILDGGICEVAFEPGHHVPVFPAILGDEVLGIFPVQLLNALGQMVDVQGKKLLFVAFHRDGDLLGFGLLDLGELRRGHLFLLVAGGKQQSKGKKQQQGAVDFFVQVIFHILHLNKDQMVCQWFSFAAKIHFFRKIVIVSITSKKGFAYKQSTDVKKNEQKNE